MKKITFLKLFLLFIAIISFTFTANAQHLFAVSQNNLSKKNVTQLETQISKSEISTLSLMRNNENKDVYPVALSSAQNTKIIILNEQTGDHVVITPVEESLTEFQLSPFFIEEMKQATLGDANRYVVMETGSDLTVRNISAVDISNEAVYIPRYFYGNKGDVKEALPKDRQIIHIFKEKPKYIPAFPDDPENLRYVSQLEEEMSYYVYMYQLPDESLCIYDEHFNPVNNENYSKVGRAGNLQFVLTGELTVQERTATEYALELWSTQLAGTIPVDISVSFVPLETGVLGATYRMQSFLDNTTYTYYPPPLLNQLKDYDQSTGKDIKIEMNSNYSSNYYFGVDGLPGSKTDWVTVLLHEATHGLGFAPLCGQDGRYFYITSPEGSYGTYTNYPGIYDRQLFQGLTGPCLTDLTQSERVALFVSDNLFAGAPGSNLVAANGSRVKVYAPTSYQAGSSTSHWAQSVTFPTFMKYVYSGVRHAFNDRKIGILVDMGWTKYNPNPEDAFVSFNANGGIGNMGIQKFTIGVAQNLKENMFQQTGHSFKEWNTLADGTGTSYQDQEEITISGDIDIYAQWEPTQYTLTFNPGDGATVDPTSKQVTYQMPVGELPIPVRPGYTFQEWRIGPLTISENYIWTYVQNMTVTARWVQTTSHIITSTATAGGTISPLGSISVTAGTNQTYTIAPQESYWILDVLVDDESQGALSEYTFENVKAPHTIHAVFTNVGIKETQQNATIEIVPNPANHTIELRIKNYELEVNRIELYNIFGQMIKTVPFEGAISKENVSQKINITDLCPGLYMVKVGSRTVKLIVN